MNDLPETLEQLSSRLEALERRVQHLEESSPGAVSAALPAPAPARAPILPAQPTAEQAAEQVTGVFSLLGRCMLGIAGAYLLRALAESSMLPREWIAAIAIVYAIAWLVGAARAHPEPAFAAAFYAGTSALILAPMLWELTMRFHVLAPWASAAVLGAFVVAITSLTWKRERSKDLSVAYAAAALTAVVLSIVTHVMMPFLALLLVMAAFSEYKSLRDGGAGIRVLVAALTDCAVWALIFIYRSPESTRADYPALDPLTLVAPACLLFLVMAASLAVSTVALRRRITAYETMQATFSFLLAICATLFLVPHAGSRIVGVVCLVFSGVCYAAGWGIFRRAAELRNFYVFSLWSASLFFAGVFLCLPPVWAVVCLTLAAVISAFVALRIGCVTLECHGIAYLCMAAASCGLAEYALRALAGAMPDGAAAGIFLVAAGALLCYVAAREVPGEALRLQLLHLVPALMAAGAVTALLTHGIVRLVSLLFTPDVFHIAFIRTFTVCAIALVLAFAGSRWRRLELTRAAYVAIAFVAAKLVFEDLRLGHMEFIAASIFLFAMTLIGVPRLSRTGGRI